jgi:hypothetical protein
MFLANMTIYATHIPMFVAYMTIQAAHIPMFATFMTIQAAHIPMFATNMTICATHIPMFVLNMTIQEPRIPMVAATMTICATHIAIFAATLPVSASLSLNVAKLGFVPAFFNIVSKESPILDGIEGVPRETGSFVFLWSFDVRESDWSPGSLKLTQTTRQRVRND